MTVKQIISFAADLAAVFLMIFQMVRLNKLSGEKDSIKQYFQRLCGVVFVISVLNLLGAYADVQLGGLTPRDFGRLSEYEQTAWYVTEVTAWIGDIFLTTVFMYMWITFLGWYLFEDKDFIKRKFWVGFTPLIFSAGVTCISIPQALLSEQGFRFFILAVCLFFVIRIIYFLLSLWLLREYKNQNGYLRFFNPWVFFVPVFAGWLLQDIFTWEFSALGSTLGVVLLYASMNREQQYIDPETGFYNMGFVSYLKELIKKGEYAPCSAMTFTLDSPGKMKEFAEILKQQLPQDCEPILHSDREIVVLANVRERGPLSMVIGDVKAVTDVKAGTTLKKKTETTEEFMERVL